MTLLCQPWASAGPRAGAASSDQPHFIAAVVLIQLFGALTEKKRQTVGAVRRWPGAFGFALGYGAKRATP